MYQNCSDLQFLECSWVTSSSPLNYIRLSVPIDASEFFIDMICGDCRKYCQQKCISHKAIAKKIETVLATPEGRAAFEAAMAKFQAEMQIIYYRNTAAPLRDRTGWAYVKRS